MATFRIHRLRIEGFKAFSDPQSFDFSGHVFVFGRNGLGKSSVVEAVRWCLFGLADRPEVEVRNVFYSVGDCRVELELQGPNGRWRVERRLRAGGSRSRLTIRDPSGVAVPQADVFPHIARLGPREGTHIIYASQSAGRRLQADITDFDRVLYSYLRIEDVPDLLKLIDAQLEEQAEVQRQHAKNVDAKEASLRAELDVLRARIDDITAAPPWPVDTVPTNAETDTRIREFVEECGGSLESSDGATLNRDWLLKEAERAIRQQSASVDSVEEQWREAKDALHQLVTAKETFDHGAEQLRKAKDRVASCDDDLNSVLGDSTKERLLKERDELGRQGDQRERHLQLMQQATAYYEDFLPQQCPVCDAVSDPEDVASRLQDRTASGPGDVELANAIEAVEARLQVLSTTERGLRSAKLALADADSRAAEARQLLGSLLDEPADLSSADVTASRLKERVQLLGSELSDSGSLVANRRTALKSLRREVQFQEHLSRKEQLHYDLVSGLEPAREALGEFVRLMDTLRAIRGALQDSFNSTLNGTLPRINGEMTEVFSRLTQQASFPEVVVKPGPADATRTLSVLVTSDRTPGAFFQPSEVLNGQAFNALNLVPYFVFSQFQAEALELDCLLIDDPSQSFDTSRVELLMRELAAAALHAQLVVASHEEDRFSPFIEEHFPSGSYRVLRVTSFDPNYGPKFECAD